MKTVVVIPARLSSTRLPNKVLIDLEGKSLIQRVFENCSKGIEADNIWIACDHESIRNECLKFTTNILITDEGHASGTDRVAEAAQNIDCDIVVNVQADEPFFDVSLIKKLSKALENSTSDMASAFATVTDLEEIKNPNLVKVVTDANENAIYFSRFPIPFLRDKVLNGPSITYKKHLGVYAYKKEFLLKYASMKQSFLEDCEKLEQLRVLENGFSIKMVEALASEKGIDTIEDLELARKIIRKKNK
jgi:3-deoxy-manno-octulosonate cytidylyltransferase (CMP-KDO synthetase)